VVFCYALGKAQRLLAELYQRCPHRRNEVVLVHGAVEPITALYRAAGVTMLATEVLGVAQDEPVTAIPEAPAPRSGKRKSAGMLSTAGRLVIAPPAAAGSPWLNRLAQPRLAFASGWMQVRGVRRRSQYERGFVLSDHADWPGLIASIEQSGARKVLATHGNTEALVRYCVDHDIDAVALRTELGGEN
jgi:putative mRNA 3-end processing factor